MSRKHHYPIAPAFKRFCALTKASPQRAFRRAGLTADYLDNETHGVDAATYFRIIEAFAAESQDPDFLLKASIASANGPIIPAIYAFACSPTLRAGLTRLALFKPLIGPITLEVTDLEGALRLEFGSADPDAPISPAAAACELAYIVEICRKYSAEPIAPLAATMPELRTGRAAFDTHFGVSSEVCLNTTLTLAAVDADLPLISENAEMWGIFETELKKQLAARQANCAMAERVKAVLLDLLPAGSVSVDDVCERLALSRRTLQRKLNEEGKTFRQLLDSTRSELAMHYLSKGNMSTEEISYLLAFQDPNSFYRAFQSWTGMTPSEARGMRRQ